MHPELAALVHRQGGVFSRAQALVAGYPHDEVRLRAARGDWVRLRHGVLAPRAIVEAVQSEGPAAQHVLMTRANLLILGSTIVASHTSGLLVHGMPTLGRPPDRVMVTGPRATPRVTPGLRVHRAVLEPEDLAEVCGIPVTSLARTVVDVARAVSFGSAVVSADGALASQLVDRDGLESVLNRQAHWPGHAAAARVLDFADGRAESAGESLTRVVLSSKGLAPSALQLPVLGADGVMYRADLAWEGCRTLGEFDGKVKYDDPARPDRGDPLWQEKRREDALREAGWEVVRIVWADLKRPEALAQRMLRAFERGLRRAA